MVSTHQAGKVAVGKCDSTSIIYWCPPKRNDDIEEEAERRYDVLLTEVLVVRRGGAISFRATSKRRGLHAVASNPGGSGTSCSGSDCWNSSKELTRCGVVVESRRRAPIAGCCSG
jgi:hypothetical protein